MQIAGTDSGTLSIDGVDCDVDAQVFISSLGDILAEAAVEVYKFQCVGASSQCLKEFEAPGCLLPAVDPSLANHLRGAWGASCTVVGLLWIAAEYTLGHIVWSPFVSIFFGARV
ncbi:MAG: hypothetical protein HC767_06630 [Akkermansiaceae bacterium]|nr:hypothetical protein [Akkermansiaceae bacterium]